jgi:hypothetical protein
MTNFWHIGFEVIPYDYNCLRHLIIDLLIANDKISTNVSCDH